MIYMKYSLETFFLFFLLLAIIPSPNVSSQATFQNDSTIKVAVCDEQLQICVDEFNSLLADFRNGSNCNSETFNQLKKKNWELTQDREIYKEKAEKLEVYQNSFYALFALLIILIILFFVSNSSKNKLGRFRNGRKTGKEGKEKNR